MTAMGFEFATAGRIVAGPGRAAELPGVLRFDVIQDEADPEHVVLVEVYRDGDASAAHKLTPHYAAWRDAVAEMMAEPRASTRFSAVFPPDDENWASSAP